MEMRIGLAGPTVNLKAGEKLFRPPQMTLRARESGARPEKLEIKARTGHSALSVK